MTGRGRAAGSAVGLLALLGVLPLAGCVGPGRPEVREIAPEEVPYDLLDPAPQDATLSTGPVDVPAGELATPVYLVDADGVLRPSLTSVRQGSTPQVARQVLDRLVAGPTEAERGLGLAGALGPGLALRVAGVDDAGVVEVELGGTASLPDADQVPLAIGQVVLSLAAVPGVSAVQVVSDGEPLPVPLPGGRLTTEPVTGADYVGLTLP